MESPTVSHDLKKHASLLGQARGVLRDVHAHAGARLWLLLVLLFLVALSDGLSMALLYPLLETVGLGASGAQGTAGMAFQWVFTAVGVKQTLLSASVLLVSAAFVQGVLFTAQNWMLLDIQKKYVAAWQQRLFSDFIAAEWTYIVSQKSGEMLNLILIETPRLGLAFFAILQLIIASIVLCVYLAISLIGSWKLTLFLLAGGLLMFLAIRPIRVKTRRYGAEFTGLSVDLGAAVGEMLSGAKLIKASAGEGRADALVAERVDRMRANLTWSAFLPTTVRSVFEFAGILMILGALIYGLKIEQVSAAQLLVVIAIVARLFPRLMQMNVFHNAVNLSVPAYGELGEIHRRFAAHRETRRGGSVVDIDSILPVDITAHDLVMRYGDKAVLDRISFDIPSGRIVGFVGPSGAGKSTILDILLGLVEPTDGRVLIGSQPLRNLDLAAWRKKIGYVTQDTFLFHDTIANNIRWSAPDVPLAAVQEAAHAAGLDSFVAALPAGYDTVVGDRGAKLSGGQRQRISIARALIRKPALLILDEATSALDSLSEQEVMNVINALGGSMTIIIVAHRLATVRYADQIYVLDQGRIVEAGSWSALSGQTSLFQRLMQAQTVTGDSR